PEAHVGGIVGPLELGTIHPELAQYLTTTQPGQLEYPLPVQNWWLIVRLEKLFPARLDTVMRQRLLQELFDQWLSEKLNSYSVASRCN
ncbi:MAG TPA: peptidylprolyl isomerase, partial [Trichocoleus sp.]